MKHFNLTLGLVAAAALAAPLSAQGRNSVGVPPGQMPPAGMCRIWIDGVPPGHQPRPTDCITAERNVPRNGRVIYGSNARGGGKYGRNGDVNGNNNGVYDRNGDGVIDRRDQVGTNCHWYDINCTTTAASNEGWTLIGRDRNGTAIYERRRTDRNGNTQIQRARRDSNGRFVIISRDTQGRNSRGEIENRNDRVVNRDRDYDNDGIDDRYENQTNVRNDQVWYDTGNGKGKGNGKYKDKGNKKH
jgi:hypothetical protein